MALHSHRTKWVAHLQPIWMIRDQCTSARRGVNSNLNYSFEPTSGLKQLSISMLVIWENVVGNMKHASDMRERGREHVQYDSSDEMWGSKDFSLFHL